VDPFDKIIKQDKSLMFEDDNCKIQYNFWKPGGDIGFTIYNKTNKNINLKLDQCFFILNGLAYDYFKNRSFNYSTSTGSSIIQGSINSKSINNSTEGFQSKKVLTENSLGMSVTSGLAVSYNENKDILIPPKAAKIISEFKINETLFRDCNLFLYPSRKQARSLRFSQSDSPFIFNNRITYTIGISDKLVEVDNKFYVSEISNYYETEILDYEFDENCGQKGDELMPYFKNSSVDKFYIKYSKKDYDVAH
jgi:hypothetical protein